jgi:hypothetical protein
MSSSSKQARRRSRKPSTETTAERIVIMPATVGRWRKNLQPFSVLRSFEQAQARLGSTFALAIASPWASFASRSATNFHLLLCDHEMAKSLALGRQFPKLGDVRAQLGDISL